jgi:aryl-alcohol dehydrogenase-like predicted oxidoreductase
VGQRVHDIAFTPNPGDLMRYRQLGQSGLTVSVVGLGCRLFGQDGGQDAASAAVDAAMDCGITLFDTAHSYGTGESERLLGQALRGRRDEVVIATKFGSRRQRVPHNASGSRRYIRKAVEDCLTRLHTDYVDLYQQHFPDPLTPVEETLDALDELVRDGLVRYVGCSNFEAWQIVEAEWAARGRGTQRFVGSQHQYSLLDRRIEADVVPVCERYRVGIMAWRPLEDGILAGAHRTEPPPLSEFRDVAAGWVAALNEFGRQRGVGILDLAIGGLAAFPAVTTVLVGARHRDRIRANAKASEWVPEPSDLKALREVSATGPATPVAS